MSELEERLGSLLENPEELSRVTELAKGLMDGGFGEKLSGLLGGAEKKAAPPEDASSAADGPSPEELAGIRRVMSAVSSGGDKTALLSAMKPYLAESRRRKLDRAIKIAKLARIAGAAFGPEDR